ncbi:uncharacterized protein [Venturia canescens]|uniref:uncharacterized protein n=1 Tax=Venturia canescens TaxID=32260 RepID=UPI001C9C2322|nr:uncharacterized protein LOC122416004 [Venturia canescens]
MKTVAIFVTLFFALALAEDEDNCPLGEALKKNIDICIEELNPSEETLKLMSENKGIENPEVQCFWACLMRKGDLMKDAKFQFDKLEELIKEDEELDSKKAEEITEMIKSCKSEAEVSDDECEVAAKYGMCLDAKKKEKQ